MLPYRPSAYSALFALCALPAAVDAQADYFPAPAGGEVRITPFAGAGVQVEYGGVVLHVDPWSRGDYSSARPASVVLVTDTPADHLDPDLIGRLRTPTTTVIVPSTPADARDEGGARRLRRLEGAEVMNNGDRRVLDFSRVGTAPVTIEAVAMYDLIPGQPFHAKGEGNGYVVTLGGLRIYFAGVTECTPEMRAVQNVDIMFVPMNLPNGRMPPAAAADCVREIGPEVVYPYHYRERPIDEFIESLEGGPIDVRLHDWYPPA